MLFTFYKIDLNVGKQKRALKNISSYVTMQIPIGTPQSFYEYEGLWEGLSNMHAGIRVENTRLVMYSSVFNRFYVIFVSKVHFFLK